MKIIVLIAITFSLVSAISDEEKWKNFKSKFDKTYESRHEEKIRFKTFQENLRKIETHNKNYQDGLVSYKLGINHFADVSEEEFTQRLNMKKQTMSTNISAIQFKAPSDRRIPDSIDWRDHNAVTAVKDQGACGSCYIFSAVGALESHYFLHSRINNKLLNLSEQFVLDCQNANNGCVGGWNTNVFKYIRENGILEDKNYYPYKGLVTECKANGTIGKGLGYLSIPHSEVELKAAVGTLGPVSFELDASNLYLYAEGIYDNPGCSSTYSNHQALIVGYGSQQGKDYWLVKNSWGTSFGESGYVKMSRNKDNQCGIANGAIIPILD